MKLSNQGLDWESSHPEFYLRFNVRPIVIVIAGPNGAGKTTFYHSYLKAAALRFLNADLITRELQVEAYEAARLTAVLRDELIRQRESFVLETVFSDPVGDKLAFLKNAVSHAYTVVLCYIGISSPQVSEERVAMRVSQGGHDVPTDKLNARFLRTLANLKAAIPVLPQVLVYDNDDLRNSFRPVAIFENGSPVFLGKPLPNWFTAVV